MPNINIAMAENCLGEVPDTHIHIDTPLPLFKTPEDAESFFDSQAERLLCALKSSLPGGTFDLLLAKMKTYRASLRFDKED